LSQLDNIGALSRAIRLSEIGAASRYMMKVGAVGLLSAVVVAAIKKSTQI
jgi:hypothetical protein